MTGLELLPLVALCGAALWGAGFRPSEDLELDSTPAFDPRRTREDQLPAGVGTLGMKLFIASLSFIFAASILLYLMLLVGDEAPETRVLPVVAPGLAVSTALILLSSVTFWLALKAVRRNDQAKLGLHLNLTLGLGLLFCVSQGVNWWQMYDAGLAYTAPNGGSDEAAFTGQERFFSSRQSAMFVVLTVLHALHVLGGLVRLIQVRLAAAKAEYSSGHHEPLLNAGLYWHFLDVVWVLMLVAILVVTH